MGAETASESLSYDAIKGGSDEERLYVHLSQAGDGARRIVGVQSREHEVASE